MMAPIMMICAVAASRRGRGIAPGLVGIDALKVEHGGRRSWHKVVLTS